MPLHPGWWRTAVLSLCPSLDVNSQREENRQKVESYLHRWVQAKPPNDGPLQIRLRIWTMILFISCTHWKSNPFHTQAPETPPSPKLHFNLQPCLYIYIYMSVCVCEGTLCFRKARRTHFLRQIASHIPHSPSVRLVLAIFSPPFFLHPSLFLHLSMGGFVWLSEAQTTDSFGELNMILSNTP